MFLDNFIVIFENLPWKIKGFTVYDAADGYYTIVLNARISYEEQQLTFKHEINHIKNEDLLRPVDVGLVEYAR